MFEEKAIDQANKKYPIPLVCDQLDFARNRKYEEGFKDGAEVVDIERNDGFSGFRLKDVLDYIQENGIVKKSELMEFTY